MKISDLAPKQQERMFICGINGSGKTYITNKILDTLPKNELIFIMDSKGEWECREWYEPKSKAKAIRLHPYMKLWALRSGQYVYRSEYPDYKDPFVTKLFRWIFKRKNCTLVIDEINDFALANGKAMPLLAKLIRQGRQKNIRMIMGSQRPMDVPTIALSESKQFCIFYLRASQDVTRVQKWVHPAIDVEQLDEHDFYNYNMRKPRAARLVMVKAA